MKIRRTMILSERKTKEVEETQSKSVSIRSMPLPYMLLLVLKCLPKHPSDSMEGISASGHSCLSETLRTQAFQHMVLESLVLLKKKQTPSLFPPKRQNSSRSFAVICTRTLLTLLGPLQLQGMFWIKCKIRTLTVTSKKEQM